MKTVEADQAISSLSALLAAAERGEEVTIVRDGTPIARLLPAAAKPARQPGLLRSMPGWSTFTYDPTLFAPLGDDELAAEGWE